MSEPYIQYVVDDSTGVNKIRISNNLSNFLPVDSHGFMHLPVPLRIFTCNAVDADDSTYVANASARFNAVVQDYIINGTDLTPFGYVKGVMFPYFSDSKVFGRKQLNVAYYITHVKNVEVTIDADVKVSYDLLNYVWPDRWYPVAVTDILRQPYHIISDFTFNGSGSFYLSRPRVLSFNDIQWSWFNPTLASNKLSVGAIPMHIG